MKWVALGLLVLGFILFLAAYKMDQTASFEGGEFIGVIVLILAGLASCAAGAIWLVILMFMAM